MHGIYGFTHVWRLPKTRFKETKNVEDNHEDHGDRRGDGSMVRSARPAGARGAAAEPAGKAAPAASPGATALQKAAKDNKYLFIFFWREDTQQSRVMRGVFQRGDGENGR